MSARILVVAKDLKGSQALARVLKEQGYQVQLTPEAAYAHESVFAFWPDLVLLEMGGADQEDFGEFCQFMRGEPETAGLPLIALTATGDLKEVGQAFAQGVDDVIRRPFDTIELFARVRSQLRLRREMAAVETKRRDLAVLLELSLAFASSLDLDDILHQVTRRMAEIIHVDRCSIVLVGEDSNQGVVVASSDDDSVHNLPLNLAKYPEIQQVLTTRSPFFAHDPSSHPLLKDVADFVALDVRSLGLFPILFHSRCMGVLFLRSSRPKEIFTEREIHLCSIITSSTAIAIRNAKIFQTVREKTKRIDLARFEAERKLRALKRYEDFFENSPDGMIILDKLGTLLYGNHRGRILLGFDREQMGQVHLSDLVVEESRGALQGLLTNLASEDSPQTFDLHFKTASGIPITLSISSSTILEEYNAALLTFRDVTEARRMEAELRRTKEFLERLIGSSVDAIVAADPSGTIILFNKGAETIFGYRPDDVLGKMNVESFYPPGAAREVMRQIRSNQFGGRGKLEPVRREVLDSMGRRVPVSMTAALIYEGDRETASFAIITDIRERIRIERKLNRVQEKLAQSEKQMMLAELAGATAHELNQPLTSITVYCQLLLRRLEADPENRKALEVLIKEVGRMSEIINQLGKITRYETKSYLGDTRILDLEKASDAERGSE